MAQKARRKVIEVLTVEKRGIPGKSLRPSRLTGTRRFHYFKINTVLKNNFLHNYQNFKTVQLMETLKDIDALDVHAELIILSSLVNENHASLDVLSIV